MTIRDLNRAFRNHLAWGGQLNQAIAHLLAEERFRSVANMGKSNNRSPGFEAILD